MSFLDIITSSKFKGTVSILAALVMHFTPDHIDVIIEAMLGAFGMSSFLIPDRKKNTNTLL